MGHSKPPAGPSVTIIGSGFAGLGMAIKLKEAGYHDITIFEKADDVGGCWRDNTYPGAACDVPSHLYSFSFEPKSNWSRRFAPQSEILEYLRHCARKYDVLPHIRFNTEVVGATFDELSSQWTVELSDGSTHTSTLLIPATGQLNRPAYPRIPGIDTFAGEMFHSARWNHDYDLTGKRVAVVGTGASAIQFVPQIAPRVAELTLFQRAAPHVLPKPDYSYPRLIRAVFNRIPALQRLSRLATYWQLEPRALAFTKFPQLMAPTEYQFRKRLRRQITDQALLEKLTPADPIGCKRILISNDYYDATVRANVEVVTSAITEIRPGGVVTAEGRVHEVDAIILGTGFQATDMLAPMHITGRGGRALRDEWAEGAEAYLGISVAQFPNLFILYGPNTGLGHTSVILMHEAQINYVIQAIAMLAKGDVGALEVRGDVQQRFNEEIQERIQASVWDQGCTSWLKTESGKNPTTWPGFTFSYFARTRRLNLDDYLIEPTANPVVVGAGDPI
ncbi:NAD(P)/FAD-dependent oxidoreductase [Nocardia sp. NBC_00565]|nr:NAD(P)/FAD-dependent oxidoreductase [Nocardia sp. NBC_00565]